MFFVLMAYTHALIFRNIKPISNIFRIFIFIQTAYIA